MMAFGELSFDKDQEDQEEKGSESMSKSTTSGGEHETKWVVVAETAGLAPAEIMAQRLQSEGIPARAWQEGAGQVFGLTVGLLGNGHVIVPESYAEKAKEILSTDADLDEDFDFETDDDSFSDKE